MAETSGSMLGTCESMAGRMVNIKSPGHKVYILYNIWYAMDVVADGSHNGRSAKIMS